MSDTCNTFTEEGDELRNGPKSSADPIEATERPRPLLRNLLSLDLVDASSVDEELRKVQRRLSAVIGRLESLEELITDKDGRRHGLGGRSIDDGIVTPWDYYRGEVERLSFEVAELRCRWGNST